MHFWNFPKQTTECARFPSARYILHVFTGRRVFATHPERRIQHICRTDHSSIQNNLFIWHLEDLRVFSNLSLRFSVNSSIVNKVTTAISGPLTLNRPEAFHLSHKLWRCFKLRCHLQSGTEATEKFQIKSFHYSTTDTVVWNMTSPPGLIFIVVGKYNTNSTTFVCSFPLPALRVFQRRFIITSTISTLKSFGLLWTLPNHTTSVSLHSFYNLHFVLWHSF